MSLAHFSHRTEIIKLTNKWHKLTRSIWLANAHNEVILETKRLNNNITLTMHRHQQKCVCSKPLVICLQSRLYLLTHVQSIRPKGKPQHD